MSRQKKMEGFMRFVCTIVVVENVLKSRELYEKILNQKVIADFGEFNVAFEGGLALYKKSLYQRLLGEKQILNKSNNFEIYFEEEDLTKIEKKIEELDFEFIHKIKEEPWKQKVFRFYDYDNNNVVIAENMNSTVKRLEKENITIEEIVKVTGMPKNEIEAILKK